MLQEKQIEINGCVLNYVEGPNSGPPVLLLHGITDAWQCFMPVIPMLLPRWHVFALDFRGHGASEHTSDDYTLTVYASDVKEFLEQIVKESVAIYGHSLGGMVGILLAAHHPELVRGLIVGDSILYRETAQDFSQQNGAGWQSWRDQLGQGLPADELASESRLGGSHRPASRNMLLGKTNAVVDPAVLDMVICSRWDDYDCSELFKSIECPVVFFQSEVMRREDVDRALKELRTGYAMHFDDLGHGLHMMPNGSNVTLAVQQILEGMGS